MSEKTNAQLTTELARIESTLKGMSQSIANLKDDVESKICISDLNRKITSVKDSINTLAKTVSNLENKLSKVYLPDDTRYYLEQTEVADFRNSQTKLLAMMADFDKLYKSLVAYTTSNSS